MAAVALCTASCGGSSVSVEQQHSNTDSAIVASDATALSGEAEVTDEFNPLIDTAPPAPSTTALKILTIGDSITSGYNSCSYRTPLITLLHNHQVEFVGSLSHSSFHPENCANSNMAHEGRAGSRTIDWLQDEGNGNSRAFTVARSELPDIVLLHIGSNDINRSELPGEFDEATGLGTETIGRINNMLDEIFNASPDVTIFLADIIPWLEDPVVDEGLAILRNQISKLAMHRALANDRLHLVRVYEEFSSEYMQADLIHPNAKGDRYLATKWLQALQASGFLLNTGIVSNIRVEAELGNLTGHMEVGTDQDATYVKTIKPTAFRAEHVSIDTTITHTGLYRILGRVKRESTDSGSLFFQVPPAESQPWFIPVSEQYTTDYVGEGPRMYLYLEAGTHSFNIFSNRTDTYIDWIEFQYLGEDPNGDADDDGVSNVADAFPNDSTR